MLIPENYSEKAPVRSLEALDKDIEGVGLVVIDEVRNLPAYEEPFVSPHLVIVLNHEGISHGEYDMCPVTFRRHEFSVFYPNHSILLKDSSDDYCVTFIIVSDWLYEQLRPRLTYGNSPMFHYQPSFQFSDEQYQCVCAATRLLKAVSRMNLKRRMEVIADILDLLSLLADEFRQMSSPEAALSVGKKTAGTYSLFNRFYENLVAHHCESREVRFYARQLCLSPKYFGTIIKQETGVSAGEWIARYVVIRAKTLLRHRPDLTIQQIYQQLGFTDAATFSRYFKATAGMSAKAYRELRLR